MQILNSLNGFLFDKIPFFIIINFIILILLIYLNFKPISDFLKKISKKAWLSVLMIFIFALWLRIFVPYPQHIIYIDEPWYMEAAKNMMQTGSQGDYPKFIGWPFVLSIAFRIFGISNWVALYASTFFGALSVILMFLVSYIITKKENIAIISAFLLAIFPSHIIWSASAETNVASLFFILSSIFFCFLYYNHENKTKKSKKNYLLWLTAMSIAFTSQFRTENYSLMVLFIIGLFIYEKNLLKKIDLNFILPIIFMLLLSFANFVQVVNYQASVDWIQSDTGGKQAGSNWSFGNFMDNSINYGINLFDGENLPVIITLFFILGLFFICYNQKKEAIFLLIWFILFWIIYFTSWFQTLAGQDRFFMSFYPMIVISCAYGIVFLSDIIVKFFNFKFDFNNILKIIIKQLLIIIILAAIIASLIPYIIEARQEYSDDAHLLETKIPELAEKDIPKDCIIIANWPTILKSTTNLNVIDIDFFLENTSNQASILNSSNCTLFFEDYCCLDWTTYGFQEKCDKVKSQFNLERFKSYKFGSKEYSFYKLKNKN